VVCQVRVETADINESPLPRIDFQRNPRKTSRGLSCIEVGELADLFFTGGVDDIGRDLLLGA
jgi:hypothetical protein